MATPIPEPNFIIIWLDQHIGLIESNKQLKTGVDQQADPECRLPESPFEKNINELIQFRTKLDQSFDKIPKNLKAFSEVRVCLDCIGENIGKKKIFFITSGSMGKEIAPEIMVKYPSLKTIYVFCGYIAAHLEWVENCLDQGIDCIMKDFHTDMLVRLLQDVAEYFVSQGDEELSRDQQLAYSAIHYFTWAKLLWHRANNFDMKKLLPRLKYAETRIEFCEQLLNKLNNINSDDDKVSGESYS